MTNFLMQRLLFLILCFLFTFSSVVNGGETVQLLEKTPFPQLKAPPIQKFTLKNGLKIRMLKDPSVPVVRGFIFMRTGSIYEPVDKLGLASLTGVTLRSGGTKSYSPELFNQILADRGAEISSAIDREKGLIAFRCLKEDLPKVLELTFEMLKQPRFDISQVQLGKLKLLEELRRQNDSPAKIARRIFPKLIYGQDNIWSRIPTSKMVQNLNQEDIRSFYQKFFFPDRVIMAVSGDFDPEQLKTLIEKYSNDWPASKQPLPQVAKLTKSWKSGLYLVPKNVDQSTVILGHFGDQRFNPDKFALQVLNNILGGDLWASRLGRQIRSTLGLAYGIYSNFGLKTDHGIFTIFAQTKGESTQKVLQETKKILTELVQGQTLTEAELNIHKQSIINSLYAEYEPKYNFVKNEAQFEYLGYPPNYIEKFAEEIKKVSLNDIRRVAKKYLKPESLKILVVGKPQTLDGLPNIETLDLSKY